MASQQQSETSKQAGDGTGPLLNVNENGDEWDEARLEEGLKVLKEMHIQLRNLRSTIPRLLTPLSQKHKSPQHMISNYQTAVQTMNKEVQTFKEVLTGEEAKKVMDYAKGSREKDGTVRQWFVTEHPGWSNRDT